MNSGERKMLGQSRSKVVLSELKIYDLIKIILNRPFKENVYNWHGQQLREATQSLGDEGQTCGVTVSTACPRPLYWTRQPPDHPSPRPLRPGRQVALTNPWELAREVVLKGTENSGPVLFKTVRLVRLLECSPLRRG